MILKVLLIIIINFFYTGLYALTFHNYTGEDIVGKIFYIYPKVNDNFMTLGKKYNIGYHELTEANPRVNPKKLNPTEEILIPQKFILPKIRSGIVINLPELRLYYFHKNKIITYPVGIGKQTSKTPIVTAKIIKKTKDPYWIVPKSIAQKYRRYKINLPKIVPAGANNPLGKYAMYLDAPGYLIHGTNSSIGVGLRSSHGCIRLYPENIKELFNLVNINTPVHIINNIYKLGTENNLLYLESHKPLSEHKVKYQYNLPYLQKIIAKYIKNNPNINLNIDHKLVDRIYNKYLGFPLLISKIN